MTDYQKRIGLIGLSGMLAVLLLCKFCLSVGEASALDFSNTVLVGQIEELEGSRATLQLGRLRPIRMMIINQVKASRPLSREMVKNRRPNRMKKQMVPNGLCSCKIRAGLRPPPYRKQWRIPPPAFCC